MLKPIHGVLFVFITGGFLLIGPASAYGAGGFYIRGDVGGSFSRDMGGEFVGDLGESVGFGFGIGYRFFSAMRMDIVGIYRPDFEATVSHLAKFQSKATNLTVICNGYWDIIRLGSLTPYIGVGIGLARNATHDASSDLFADLQARASGRERYDFAYQATGGFSLALIPKVDLDLSYRYLNAGKVAYRSSGKLLGEDFRFFKTGPKETLRLNEVFLSVRYNF